MGAALIPEVRWRAIDENGEVVPGALAYFWSAGTSTPKTVYEDSDLTVPLGTIIEADAGGLFPAMFASPSSYKVGLYPADPAPPVVPTSTPYWTTDDWQSPNVFAENFGTVMAAGQRNVTNGDTLLLTDRLVTVASSGATTFNLLAASLFTMEVTIKNMGSGTVVIKANGADLIDTIAGSPSQFTLEAAATPLFPAVTLRPITGGWYIVSSHRAA